MNSTNDYTAHDYKSQVQNLLIKTQRFKNENKRVIKFLDEISSRDDDRRASVVASHLNECASYVGFTNIDGVASIVKANFCRERVCMVCAWRRQARFLAQLHPLLASATNLGYQYIFVTLTLKNCCFDELRSSLDVILSAYDKLLKRRKVSRAWRGIVRSLELTYNATENSFHPHLHLLVAVEKDYVTNSDLYISQYELRKMWADLAGVSYEPWCYIERIEDENKGAVETLKYSLKPSQAFEALEAFYKLLRRRRLVSFSGVFAQLRNALKMNDFENVLVDGDGTRGVSYDVYKFDASGGVYRFYDSYTWR